MTLVHNSPRPSAADNVTTSKILIVGSGTIGFGWGVAFFMKGLSVEIYDQDETRAEQCVQAIGAECKALSERGLTKSVSTQGAGLRAVAKAELANREPNFVFEAVPENLDTKRSVLLELEQVLPSDTIIASSTSALLPSDIAQQMRLPERFIVAHPFNPSYLIPLVEIVPGPNTSESTINRTMNLLTSIGLQPAKLEKEVSGFVANRLQAAVINEAMSLVDQGVASVETIDLCMSECLGLRWAFLGPFETMDLNAESGMAQYAASFSSSYHRLGQQLNVASAWSDSAISAVVAHFEKKYDEVSRYDRRKLRDETIAAILGTKASVARASNEASTFSKGSV
ncbi:MAG: 3-hydroxyacyl-CoA dehydrogenase [Henriciella sp.]